MKRVVFSDCGKFRSLMLEVWDASLPILSWCLLNPSVAGEETEDGVIHHNPEPVVFYFERAALAPIPGEPK